nr:MAG TPA: hypothetical protein [Caudoviricetes sp.]
MDNSEGSGIVLPKSCSVIPQRPIASRAIEMASATSFPSVFILRSGTYTTNPSSAGVRTTG